MSNCTVVNSAVASTGANSFCATTATGMKNAVGSAQSVQAACAAGGSCTGGRRLSENEADERQLASTPQVAVTFTITFPPGTSTTAATNAVTAVSGSALSAAITSALNAAGGATAAFSSAVTGVSAPSTPVVSVNPAGYDVCVSGAGCYFNFYAVNTHYKIHQSSHGAGFTKDQCATACTADATCEAFEYLTSPNSPACSFWLKGACNIPAGSPPGYVTGISYATYCDKAGQSRSAFTPVTSGCKNSNILGLGSVLSAFLMLAMMG